MCTVYLSFYCSVLAGFSVARYYKYWLYGMRVSILMILVVTEFNHIKIDIKGYRM
jgi:hypothetical protein